MRRLLVMLVVLAAAMSAVASTASSASASSGSLTIAASCRAGYVRALIGGQARCLHAGQFCRARYRGAYLHYGFRCVNGRLRRVVPASSPPPQQPPPPANPPGSRSNPFPLGTNAHDARWSIRINGINWDAWPIVAATNMFNDPPPAGSQDVMVNVTAQYLGSGTTAAWLDLGTSLDVVGASGISYAQGTRYSCGVIPESLDDIDTVFTGASFTVNVCWKVPSVDVATLELYFHDFETSAEGFFALR